MTTLLEDFVRGMNPLRDFEQITVYSFQETSRTEDGLTKLWKDVTQFFANLPKPFLRGAFYGALAGGIASYFTDIPLQEIVPHTAYLSSFVDGDIFIGRYLFKLNFGGKK